MDNKLLIIGLDGGTFDILLPWMQKGLLPNLKKIYDEGVSGPLRTILPPITASAWTSFYTGKNPGKHGIFEFLIKKENSYQEMAVNSTFCKSKTLWDYLAEGNKKVAVLNVPMTYPPQKVNGAMICDFLSQAQKRDFTHPIQLLTEVENKFGPYYLYPKVADFTVHYSEKNVEALIDDCLKMSQYKFDVAYYLMGKNDYDVIVFHEMGTDRIQHWLWHIIDSSHPKHTKELKQKFYEKILGYYRHVDEQIGKMMELAGPQFSIFIISDHGLGPVKRSIDLNTWLLQEGYITLKNCFSSRVRYLLWKWGVTYQNFFALYEKILRLGIQFKPGPPTELFKFWLKMLHQSPLLSLKDIDWAKTKAYAKTSVIGQIIINLKGREPEGIVTPGEEYNHLLNEIVEKLRNLQDPKEGKQINGLVYTGQESFQGPFSHTAPDIIYMPQADQYQSGSIILFGSNTAFLNFTGQCAAHTMDGIFMAHGRQIKRGEKLIGAHIMDVAPTALYLMECKVPSDMDGKVLKDIFEETFVAQHPEVFIEPAKEIEETQSGMSPEEEKKVMERLRNLGYID